jgi:hypothetical protein
MSPQNVAEQFVTAINAHDVERLASLMTSDHRLIDSLGAAVEGRDSMRDGWKFYFAMVPDYRLEINRCFSAETAKDETMLVGVASGSYWSDGLKRPNSEWSTPVALRAVVRDGQIAEWQVYADNEPIRQQMRAASA